MKNLVELIKAAGSAGVSGQSFRTNVTGTADNIKVTDYLCTGMGFSGHPVAGPTYSASSLFSVTATPTAGASFGNIQRNDSGAWQFSTSTSGASVALESFSNSSGVHSLGVRVLSPSDASLSVSPVATMYGSQPSGSDPWQVQFTANMNGLGGSGTASVTVSWTYDPDNAAFNQVLTDAWTGTFTNRGYNQDTDIDYQWRTQQSTGTTTSGTGVNGALVSTQRSFVAPTNDVNHYVYPTNIDGLIPAETASLYLRWKLKDSSGGDGVWINHGTAVQATDPRPGA